MRIARFGEGPREFYALLDDADEGRIREFPRDPFTGDASPGPPRPVEGLRWLTPCRPSKIVGVGRNFHAHAAELRNAVPGEPLLFLKPPSALLPHGGIIRLPEASERVDFEGELGIVIGRAATDVPESRALEHVLGYTCLNDVTARDLQKADVQFTRAKGFDTFCPVGPCIATGLEPAGLTIETFVNGERRQSSPLTSMIFGVARLVSHISRIMTLLPGDLIAGGTPGGVGPLRPGDEVTVSIEGIGRLTNRVASAPRAGV
jgi:2-keto-4-pentenoate hydratase/2-oxohepta-3-ene-1,7-dioic acid hydratase in catechol pathway